MTSIEKIEEKIEEIVSNLESTTDFSIMREMKEILNKVFGEENNQILKPSLFTMERLAEEEGVHPNFVAAINKEGTTNYLERWLKSHLQDALSYQIIIKFPEVEITNGKEKHIMKDLYVRVLIKPDGTIRSGLSGTRGKLSIHEIRSQYAHSHLPYCYPRDMSFQPFCTGIGPINQVMMVLSTKFSVVNFKMFCFHLKVYVAWESKEGKPHMYIENISKVNKHTEYYLSESHARDAGYFLLKDLREVDHEMILSMLDYDVLPTKIEVKVNSEFEKWASAKMNNWNLDEAFPGSRIEKNCLFNTKDSSGKYHPIPRTYCCDDLYNKDKVILQFKGENIKLQADMPQIVDTEIIKDEEKVPNPVITKYISEKLSRSLSKTAFSNARIRAGSAGTSKPETAGSDPLSM